MLLSHSTRTLWVHDMLRSLHLILCLVLFTGVNAQVFNSTIVHDGIVRSYLTYVPTTWTSTANMPLVFVLHGTTQDGQAIMDISEFNTVAEDNGFITVYPDGIGGSWNTGIAGGSTADDIGLIDTLVTVHQSQYGIDDSRVFSCGFSAGGYLSYRLACESARCFAGVASVAGTMTDMIASNCNPLYVTPVLHIHGDADFIVAYNGSAIAGISVDSVLSTWNSFNSCPSVPVISARPNINLPDFSTVDEWVYSPCSMSTQNVLLKVNGGGHQWPGTNALLGGIGAINRDIDASEEIWDFFSVLDCNNIITTVSTVSAVEGVPWFYTVGNTLMIDGLEESAGYHIYNLQGGLELFGTVSPSGRIEMNTLGKGMYLLKVVGRPCMKLIR